jgi:hypothetical protein
LKIEAHPSLSGYALFKGQVLAFCLFPMKEPHGGHFPNRFPFSILEDNTIGPVMSPFNLPEPAGFQPKPRQNRAKTAPKPAG